jgi:hypothetical protein
MAYQGIFKDFPALISTGVVYRVHHAPLELQQQWVSALSIAEPRSTQCCIRLNKRRYRKPARARSISGPLTGIIGYSL